MAGAVYTCCLLIAVSSTNRVVQGLLCQKWLMALGTIAYCSYLIHMPLIQAGRRLLEFYFSKETAWLPGGMLGIAATLLIATISWKVFEKPLLRRGHRYQY